MALCGSPELTRTTLEEPDDDRSWKPFFRQLLISSCVWSLLFQAGLCFGAPTVIIPYMRDERGEHYVTRDMASWITSATNLSGALWTPLVVFLASAIGRRYTFALGTIASLVGFTVLSFADTPLGVLIGMIVQGPLSAFCCTIAMLVLTEYTSPVYRGMFLTINAATTFWGVWIANAIGTVTHWHYIAWLGLTCAVFNLLTLVFWPESPYWLAIKGKMEQCREAHRWLKGRSSTNEIESQEHNQGSLEEDELNKSHKKKTGFKKWKQIFIDMKSKCFYKSLIFSAVLACQFQFTGKGILSAYAIDIIKDITNSKHEAYKGMLIIDGVNVLGMYLGCAVSKKLTRRMLLFSAGGAGSVFLLIMSLYLYLVRLGVMLENKFTTVIILTCYSLAVCCGPIILNGTLTAELLPLHLRDTAVLVMAIGVNLLMGTFVKIAPYIFAQFGIDGTFFFYALVSGSLLVVLYIYLPETKDKSLKEIQELILDSRGYTRVKKNERI